MAKDEQSEEPSFVDQGVSNLAAEEMQLPLAGGQAGSLAGAGVHDLASLNGFNEREAGSKLLQLRSGADEAGEPINGRFLLAQVDRAPRHAELLGGGLQ